jgi:tetratricopeptide (TPR) repeat protein
VKFKFRSAISNYSFVNKSQASAFKIKSSGRSLQVNSVAENVKPANIVITEGSNTHLFILAYKSSLDASTETVYDFSSKEKLQQETQKMMAKKTVEPPVQSIQVKNTASETSTLVTQAVVTQPPNNTEPTHTAAEIPARPQVAAAADPENNKTVTVTPVATSPAKKSAETVATPTYSSEITKAAEAFNAKDYSGAKAYFQSAQKLNPSAKYPGVRIAELNVLIAKERRNGTPAILKKEMTAKNETQYHLQNTQSNHAISNEVPDEDGAVSLNDASYDAFVHIADSLAWIAKDYKGSLKWYDSAQSVKPGNTYPAKQIRAVKQLYAERELKTMLQHKKAAFNEALLYYKKADALRTERKYEESYKNYAEFLSRVDTVNSDGYMSSELHYIKEAKDYLSRLQPYQPKPKVETAAPAPTTDKRKKKKKRS